eukprot:153698_1
MLSTLSFICILMKLNQSMQSSRSDYTATIVSYDGDWGDWYQDAFCNTGTWAFGIMFLFEEYLDGGDNTAADKIQLKCADVSRTTNTINQVWTAGPQLFATMWVDGHIWIYCLL